MAEIWKNTSVYLLSKRFVVWAFKENYSRVIIIGKEHLPAEGPVMYAPNHLNALMDALVVLALPPHRLARVFLARADIFRLPRVVVNFLRFAKILPAYRIRDGYNQLDRNKDSFSEAELALLDGAAVGIMPEGNQGEERNIRPLVKGIFRIAFGAQQKMRMGREVKIIPIGIEYGDNEDYQHTLIINIGHPIGVDKYMPLYAENPAKATNELKDTLSQSLQHLSVHLPGGEHYRMYDELVELAAPSVAASLPDHDPAIRLFNARRAIGERIHQFLELESERVEELKQLYQQWKKSSNDLHLPLRKASRPFVPTRKKGQILLYQLLAGILMLPGAVTNYLPYRLIKAAPRLARIKYRGFYSSVFFGTAIVVLPLYYLLVGILLGVVLKLTLLQVLVSIPVIYLNGKLAYRLYQLMSDLRSDQQMLNISKQKPVEMESLLAIRQKIISLLT